MRIEVCQGEHEDVRFNQQNDSLRLEDLDEQADEGNQTLVRFDMNQDGILSVTVEDAEEMRMLIEQLEHAALVGDRESVDDVRHKLEDILFYLEDA